MKPKYHYLMIIINSKINNNFNNRIIILKNKIAEMLIQKKRDSIIVQIYLKMMKKN